MKTMGNFIGGQVCMSSSNQTVDVHNPATGQVERRVTQSTATEVKQAIDVAHQAFDDWARIMFNFKALLEHHRDELATLIVSEHGKVYSDALGELTRGIEVVEFACGIQHLIKGEYLADVGSGVDSFSLMQPLGVVAGITPFNFPAMVPMWMFPITLSCGNTFVLKPLALATSAAVRMAELLKEAGLPDGVFNMVHCANEDAAQLCTDPHIQAVSFVGSSAVAEHIYTTASAHGKRVQAFGAAKNQAIIMPDADLDATVKALMGGAFGSAGERCMALPVAVVVGDDTADKLIVRLKPLITQLRVGPGIQQSGEENEMGPTAAIIRCRATPMVTMLAAPCLTTLNRICVSIVRRSSDRCWALFACRTTRPPSTRWTAMNLAIAAPSLPVTANTRASSCRKCRPVWWGSTCRYRWHSTASAAGSARCSVR